MNDIEKAFYLSVALQKIEKLSSSLMAKLHGPKMDGPRNETERVLIGINQLCVDAINGERIGDINYEKEGAQVTPQGIFEVVWTTPNHHRCCAVVIAPSAKRALELAEAENQELGVINLLLPDGVWVDGPERVVCREVP